MTASGGAAGVGRAVNQSVVISLVGVFAFNYAFTALLLATHPELADDPLGDGGGSVIGWLAAPIGWLESFGEIVRFGARVAGEVYSGKAFRFLGESCARPGS